VGLVVYAALYAAAEWLVYQYGDRNRFFVVKTAPHAEYDHVILGASHAAVFDYADLNARLESLTRSKIVNLSTVGGGVTVNRLLLDYFLVEHRARTIVYVLDSFAFYSPEWNERRLEDARLFHRAPADPALARLLLQRAPAMVALDYISGFSKINNADRFGPDRPEESARFDRAYRPIEQLDRQRMAYLYPARIDAQALAHRQRYLAELEALIAGARAGGMRVLLLRPPLPPRTRALIPDEAQFDAVVKDAARRTGAELHDLSMAADDVRFFFDTDHLNRAGVLHVYDNHLAAMLQN
jgi:hypothetical protein